MKIKIRQFHNKKRGETITCTNVGFEQSYSLHTLLETNKLSPEKAQHTVLESGWETGETLEIEI